MTKGSYNRISFVRAVRYAIERKQILQEKQLLIEDLKQAVDQIKTLKGLLPICVYCKKVKEDMGYWTKIEKYIQNL